MRNNNQISEDIFYDEILQYFSDESRDLSKTEIWKDRNIISLMRMLKRCESEKEYDQKADIAKNSIILMLALFDDLPPNCFNRRGQDYNSISQKEKEELKKILLNAIK